MTYAQADNQRKESVSSVAGNIQRREEQRGREEETTIHDYSHQLRPHAFTKHSKKGCGPNSGS